MWESRRRSLTIGFFHFCFLGARKAEHDSMVWLLLHVKTDTVNKILQSQEISYRFWYMFLLHYIIYNYKLYSNFKLNYDYMLQRYLWANTLSLQLNWPQLNGERFQIEEFLTYTDVYWYWYVGGVKSMMTPGWTLQLGINAFWSLEDEIEI